MQVTGIVENSWGGMGWWIEMGSEGSNDGVGGIETEALVAGIHQSWGGIGRPAQVASSLSFSDLPSPCQGPIMVSSPLPAQAGSQMC